MLAHSFDLAALEHQDGVGFDQRRQPMRDHDDRAPRRDATNIFVDDRLAVRVQRAGRFVEDQDARIDDQRARDGEPLLLSAREVGRTLVNVSLVTARQALDEFFGAGETAGVDDLVEGRVRLGGGDVLADRAAEQEVFLQHDAKAAAQMLEVVFAHVDAVDLDQSLIVGVQALQ